LELGRGRRGNLAGQLAGCRWVMEEFGQAWAFDRIRQLAAKAREMLAGVPGVKVLTPALTAGLVSFQVPSSVKAEHVAKVLGDQGIIIRTVPHPQSLRLATGYYNTEDELERLVAALVPLCR